VGTSLAFGLSPKEVHKSLSSIKHPIVSLAAGPYNFVIIQDVDIVEDVFVKQGQKVNSRYYATETAMLWYAEE